MVAEIPTEVEASLGKTYSLKKPGTFSVIPSCDFPCDLYAFLSCIIYVQLLLACHLATHSLTRLPSRILSAQVKDLAAVSLKQPVRIFVNSNTDVAPFLRQEFIRIRPHREGDREAVVAGRIQLRGLLGNTVGGVVLLRPLLFCTSALLTRTFQDHVMLFTQTRKQAHRLHILLGLMGLKVGELHGELSQNQRLENLRYSNQRRSA